MQKSSIATSRLLPTIGWREWVSLPSLGIFRIKAKVDTGARSSCVHALHIRRFERNGKTWVCFQVHPLQRNAKTTVQAEAEVVEFRNVKSSSGHVTRRPVILADVSLGGKTWQVELTLTSRDAMGFRMLLGREAIRGRYLVHPGKSYLAGR
jgi:hypothetical protein